ncbi:MAG: SMC family ATPase [Methanobacteriota archaeon]|nr:MAG: SMC family ATPase [Euryarchaeota archaeon]
MNYLKVERLKLENVRCYDSEEFTFSENKNVLVGTNGAGKSTVINSIGIALFGTDYLTGTALKTSDLIKWGTDKASISLDFTTEKGKYRSVFEIGQNKNRWVLFDRNQSKPRRITTKITETKSKISELIDPNLDETSFKNAICSPQGMISSLLDQSDGKRKEQIYKILGVDVYKKIDENIRKLLRELKNKKEVASRELKVRKENLLDKANIERDLQANEEKLAKIKEKLPAVQKEAKALTQELELMEKMKQDYSLTVERIGQFKKDIENLERKVQETISILETKKQQTNISADSMEALQANISAIEKELEQLNSSRNEMEKAKGQYSIKKNSLENLQSDLKEELKKLDKFISSLESIKKEKGIKSAEDIRQQVSSLESELKLHSQAIEGKKKEIANKSEIIRELEKKKKEYEKEISEFKKTFKQKFGVDVSQIEKVKGQLTKEKEQLENDLSMLQTRISKLVNEIGQIKGLMDQKRQVVDLLEHAKTSSTDHAECPTCKQSLKGVDFNQLIDMHNAEIKTLRTNSVDLQQKRKKLETEEKAKEKVIDELQQKLFSLEEMAARSIKIDQRESQLQAILDDLTKRTQEQDALKTDLDKLLRIDIKTKEQHLVNLKHTLESFERLQQDIQSLTGKIESHQSQIKELQEELDKIKIDEIEKSIGTLTDKWNKKNALLKVHNDLRVLFSQVENHTSQIEDKKKQLSAFEKKLGSFDPTLFSAEKIDAAKKKLSQIQQTLGQLKTELKQLEKEKIPELQKNLEKAKIQEQEIADLTIRIDEFNIALEKYELIQEVIQSVPQTVLRQITDTVSNMTTRLVQRFLPDYGFSQIRLTPDGGLTIIRNGHQVSLNSLSGGEKTVLALALRTALAQKVVPINFMILDEPTQHLDRVRVEEFIEVMDRGNVFGGSNGQMILVTHVDEFKRVADRALEIDASNRNKRVVKVVS